MPVWSFNRLAQLGCIVKFGYLSPNDLVDIRAFKRPKMPDDQEQLLAKSIEKEGVRNPLICVAYEHRTTYVIVGHHRLWASKKVKTEQVPVIINDFCNRYPDFEIINSLEEVRTKFKDQPNIIKSFKLGVSTSEPLINNETWWQSP